MRIEKLDQLCGKFVGTLLNQANATSDIGDDGSQTVCYQFDGQACPTVTICSYADHKQAAGVRQIKIGDDVHTPDDDEVEEWASWQARVLVEFYQVSGINDPRLNDILCEMVAAFFNGASDRIAGVKNTDDAGIKTTYCFANGQAIYVYHCRESKQITAITTSDGDWTEIQKQDNYCTNLAIALLHIYDWDILGK